MKLGILNEFEGYEKNYILACKELNIDYEVVDFLSSNWISNIQNSDCNGFLVRPSFQKEVWKKMFDERLFYVNKVLKIPIYPTYEELFLYENKKNMAYWLEINNIRHPKTWIFYKKNEALEFINSYENYPLVFKTSIGSAAIGVIYIHKKHQAIKIVNKIFTRLLFFNFGFTKWIKTKYLIPFPLMDDKQYNFIILQEKIDVRYEWRMIKIGESYFGHQKLSDGKYHSGSNLVGWVDPPEDLRNFMKEICEIGQFNSMCIDIFEDNNGNYYVNELQSIFGSYIESQMYIHGVPGRYRFINNEWVFEEGVYNRNGSCNLRVLDFAEILNKSGIY